MSTTNVKTNGPVFSASNTGIPRNYHEEPVLYGFGAAPQLPDGTPVSYQQGGVLFLKRYVYNVYGLAFALTKVLVEDGDHIRIGQVYARHLAQSLIETKETLSANVLNRAFNSGATAGGDGVQLSSASHPIVNGTFSNLLSTAANLSQTSLEQMLIQIRQAVDNNGKKIRLVPRQLVVAPGNVFQAEVLLKSVLARRQCKQRHQPCQVHRSVGRRRGCHCQPFDQSPSAFFVQTDASRRHEAHDAS